MIYHKNEIRNEILLDVFYFYHMTRIIWNSEEDISKNTFAYNEFLVQLNII